MINDAENLWRQLFTATEILKTRQSDLLHDDTLLMLTLNQVKMLQQIYMLTRETPDGVTLKELTAALGTTPAAGSEMVEMLVRKAVVERSQCVTDRRRVNIRLRPEWRDRFRAVEERFTTVTERF